MPPGRPRTIVCYICGREFGSKSIGIHQPQCLKKWRIQNDALPKHLRQPEPTKPEEYATVGNSSSTGGGQTMNVGAMNEAARAAATANLRPCFNCGRRFNPDRIQKHEEICRSLKKNRTTFDSYRHRVKEFANEAKSSLSNPRNNTSYHTNWRAKHSDFIRSIRYAKNVEAVEKSGGVGGLKNLPPPPRSINADYKQCPHCTRRFAPDTAARHIPKCATTINRPKPPPSFSQSQDLVNKTMPSRSFGGGRNGGGGGGGRNGGGGGGGRNGGGRNGTVDQRRSFDPHVSFQDGNDMEFRASTMPPRSSNMPSRRPGRGNGMSQGMSQSNPLSRPPYLPGFEYEDSDPYGATFPSGFHAESGRDSGVPEQQWRGRVERGGVGRGASTRPGKTFRGEEMTRRGNASHYDFNNNNNNNNNNHFRQATVAYQVDDYSGRGFPTNGPTNPQWRNVRR